MGGSPAEEPPAPDLFSSWREAVAFLRQLGLHREADAVESEHARTLCEGPPARDWRE